MGELDSSRTRVAPIFTRLLTLQEGNPAWLSELLALPERDGRHPGAAIDRPGTVRRFGWGRTNEGHPGEVGLPAPTALLRWLVTHVDVTRIPAGRPEIEEPRRRLALGDPATVGEALAHLDRGTRPADGEWHILEGTTYPDAYLDTADLVIVVEGKRTEAGPTRKTTFMPVRDQLLRHMDAALELAGPRRVVGFYAVEGRLPDQEAVPGRWREAVAGTVSPEVVVASLPHRSTREREKIVAGVLGAVTWQRICGAFGLPLPYEG